MKIAQKKWTKAHGWQILSQISEKPQLVLAFGGRAVLEEGSHFQEVVRWYPDAHIVWCSTAGEIMGEEVLEQSLVLTAVYFEKTHLVFAETTVTNVDESEDAGIKLASQLPADKLVHSMVFSDGLKVNGTALVKGILAHLPPHVSVTGGLVGDGADFKKTLVGLNKIPSEGTIVLIGFYGTNLKVGYGSLGGWDAFGPERTITKAKGNVLYEVDGQIALALYKQYLGDQAKDLPGSGLLFPWLYKFRPKKEMRK